jgi:hypothetical protein
MNEKDNAIIYRDLLCESIVLIDVLRQSKDTYINTMCTLMDAQPQEFNMIMQENVKYVTNAKRQARELSAVFERMFTLITTKQPSEI